MLEPVHDYVLVELEEEARHTAGGVLLPETMDEHHKPRAQWGTVVAAGPGRISRKGVLIRVEVAPGERVCFDRFEGTEMVANGKQLVLIRAAELLGTQG